jgi:transcriptional regulator with XRE-family HTH domain
MSNGNEIREFLTSRRARITPAQAGLPPGGRQRRVKGLRREEVAVLADISVEYYTRLERGNANGVSSEVLEAVGRALQLDDAERCHLVDLVRSASVTFSHRSSAAPLVRPAVRRIVDAITGVPAFVRNGRFDILYANPLAEALYSELFAEPMRPVNSARFIFLSRRARSFYAEWETVAREVVAALRVEAGHNAYSEELSNLIGLLSTQSEEFRVLWASHDVRFHRRGTKRFHHPLVGDIALSYEVLELSADPGLMVLAYSAEPGSRSEEALRELAGWAATRERLTAGLAGGNAESREERQPHGRRVS